MSNQPPPPSPPPPPSNFSNLCMIRAKSKSKHENDSTHSSLIKSIKKTFLFNTHLLRQDATCGWSAYYKPCQSILQVGPSCGLVALVMAARSLDASPRPILSSVLEHNKCIESLLNVAKSKDYSKQGEMFSADNLADLATTCFELQAEVVEKPLSSTEIVRRLLLGSIALIPYDAAPNHEPCKKKGHKAHWATIFGFLTKATLAAFHESGSFRKEHISTNNSSIVCNIFCDSKKISSSSFTIADDMLSPLYLFALHGKSSHIATWRDEVLVESNGQLVEVDPSKSCLPDEFNIPADLSGLTNKSVWLSAN